MHGWLYVEMASLFVSRMVAGRNVVAVWERQALRCSPFSFRASRGFERPYIEIAIVLISFHGRDLA